MARAPRAAALAASTLALLTAACGSDDADDGPDSGEGAAAEGLIAEDAALVWSASVEEDWSVTDAALADGVLVAATKWSLEEESRVVGYDEAGRPSWESGAGYGTIELTVLDDGSVQACDDLGGEVLDAATGEVVREATEEECPEEFDGADTTADDAYEVDGAELVVHDPEDPAVERFRIGLEDPDAVAWGVDGAVATWSESAGMLRLYR